MTKSIIFTAGQKLTTCQPQNVPQTQTFPEEKPKAGTVEQVYTVTVPRLPEYEEVVKMT